MSNICFVILFICNVIALKSDACDPNTDQFSSKITLTNSSLYDVDYHNAYVDVKVKVTYPAAEYEYTLVKRGCPVPADPKGVVIEIPVNTITITETIPCVYLYELGVLRKIKATGSPSFISYKPVKSYLEEMKQKGEELINVDGFNEYGWSVTNLTKILEANSDVTLGSHWILDNIDHKIEETKFFVEESSAEPNQFGVAEIVKIFGLLTGTEDKANNIYDRIYKDYVETKEEVDDLLETHLSNVEKKKVLAGGITEDYYNPGSVFWSGPSGYTRTIIEDAGANLLDVNTIDKALESGKTADAWINLGLGYFTRSETLLTKDNRYAQIKALQDGNVWDRLLKIDLDPNHDYNANEFFQTGPLFPNLILKDLVKIFYPELMVTHQFQYYMRITPVDVSSGIDWNDESTFPTDCVVGNWTEWSDCSEKCDQGIQKRTRRVVKASAHGGEACPSLEETKACYSKCKDTTLIIILVVVFVVVIVIAAVIVWFCVSRHTKSKIRSQLIGKTPEEQKEIINHLVEI